MAEEFQLGSGNWWVSTSSSSSRNRFDSGGGSSSSSSSAAAAAAAAPSSSLHISSNSVSMGISSFGWAAPGEVVDIKARSSLDSASATASGGVLVDPNLQIMGLGLSSQPIDWNQSLFRGEKGEQNSYGSMLQQELSSNANYHHQQETTSEEQWRQRVLYSGGGGSDEASVNDYSKQQMGGGRTGFSLDQPPPHEYLGGGASTCQGLNTSFELDSSYGSPSTMLQAGLLLSNSNNQPPQQPNFAARTSMSFPYNNTPTNYGAAGDVMSSSWSKFPQFLRTTSPPKQPQPQPQPPQLHFSNNTTFWNATAAAMNDVRSSFFPSLHTQLPSSTVDEKPKNVSDVRDLSASSAAAAAAKKTSNETSGKRPRNENPSPPMPPFKVRKEKMGDRITALQQLVSPFGKTDTASVLTEAIEYIKFLHDQVNALSAPYMKSGSSMQHQQISSEKSKDAEGGARQDLRSRGLCLVPVSSTFPVTHETTADFWSPTSFGGSFR